MTKHDRLMNVLAEIKSICVKNDDAERGCGKKCPFLMGKDGDEFRDCEILRFVDGDTPEEWGEEEAQK